jgi:hypothetical protein
LFFPFLSKLPLQIKIIVSVIFKVSINCVLKYELSVLSNLLFLVCFCLCNVALYIRTVCLVWDFLLWFLSFFVDRFMGNYHCVWLECGLVIKLVDLFGAQLMSFVFKGVFLVKLFIKLMYIQFLWSSFWFWRYLFKVLVNFIGLCIIKLHNFFFEISFINYLN